MIIDESSSMKIMGNEPVEAINAFIKDQQKLAIGNPTFTLWKFHSEVKNIIQEIPLKDVTEFVDYHPAKMTALADAIGEAIETKLKSENKNNCICVIVTDGLDNCSQKHDIRDIKTLIKKCEDENDWRFIYLGANHDAFSVGNGMGFMNKSCCNFKTTRGNLLFASSATSKAVSDFRKLSSEMAQMGLGTPQLDIGKFVPNLDQTYPPM